VSAALPHLRQHLEAMRGAINETLRLLRPRGRCIVCGVREGVKHDPSPAVVVTQHMPAGFTTRFAERLNTLAQVTVQEAADGQRILPGHVYIAPGNWHLEVMRTGANYTCRLHDGPAVSGHRPSVDVLFRSVAASAGRNAIGVILTGMGKDGAEGLKQMRAAGAPTIGQNEATCIVYGMPKAAHAIGATQIELPIEKIAGAILERCSDRHVRI
jgi:two-component system, chemotaxis family, protein-glutamate methylesterase/glutaminase